MSLGRYDPHSRYKDKAAQRFTSALGFIALVFVSVLAGFWLGKQFGAEQLIKQKDEIQALTQERNLLRDQATELSAAAQTAEKRFEQLKAEVESILPEGPMQNLVTLIREQLEQGKDPERLAFFIRSARPPTGCVDPDTKRFVISTAANDAPKSVVVIADGAVEISGEGESARNEAGMPEAWYDPAKEVELSFKYEDKIETKKDILPIRYSVVVKDREYRFTIESGSKSFAKVTYDSCAYP
jgi:hypothetical protein